MIGLYRDAIAAMQSRALEQAQRDILLEFIRRPDEVEYVYMVTHENTREVWYTCGNYTGSMIVDRVKRPLIPINEILAD